MAEEQKTILGVLAALMILGVGLVLADEGDDLERAHVDWFDARFGEMHAAAHDSTHPGFPPPDPPDPPPPPAPPPPPGQVVYANDFEGPDPFRGWLGRRPQNLSIGEEGGNRHARMLWEPHSNSRTSFLQRRGGLFDLRWEFRFRLPEGYDCERYPDDHPDRPGECWVGGGHMWQLSSLNRYEHPQGCETDGQVRLDWGAGNARGPWGVHSYRYTVGCERPGEFKTKMARETYLTIGRWHDVRIDVHLNSGPGDDSGTCETWIDGRSIGVHRGEFNVVGASGGIRVFGFGNYDHAAGSPWFEVDDLVISSLEPGD